MHKPKRPLTAVIAAALLANAEELLHGHAMRLRGGLGGGPHR
jgi:hypothetical protein